MMDFIVFDRKRSDHRCQHILKQQIFETHRRQSSLDLYSQLKSRLLVLMDIMLRRLRAMGQSNCCTDKGTKTLPSKPMVPVYILVLIVCKASWM